mmetsp:Transcript_24752/g.79715  ORF Transcript_24752/g.79715 Transcript_24752/m.79715 type:complete len:423 (-) Transcript_24752:114-1382(-)
MMRISVSEALRHWTGAKDPSQVVPALVVHLNVFFYALCFWLTQPVLPFLSKQLGADAIQLGQLQTTFSVLQLIGSPLIGRLCDLFGGRAALLLSQMGGMLGYLFLGIASNVPMLFLSQLPMFLMHAMHAAQALLADMSHETARASALGRLSLSYGVGMIAGSALGGMLASSLGYHGVALLGAAVAALSIPVCLLFLPGGRPEHVSAPPQASGSSLELSAVLALLRRPAVRDLLLINVLVGTAVALQRSSFVMVAPDVFGLDAEQMGFTMSYSAVLAVLVNTFLVGWISKRYTELRAVQLAVALLTACFLAYSAVTSFAQLLVLLAPLSAASATLYTVSASAFTKVVEPRHTGTSIGLSHAARTLCGVVAPTAAGVLFERLGFGALGYTSAALCALGLAFTTGPNSWSSAAGRGERARELTPL